MNFSVESDEASGVCAAEIIGLDINNRRKGCTVLAKTH